MQDIIIVLFCKNVNAQLPKINVMTAIVSTNTVEGTDKRAELSPPAKREPDSVGTASVSSTVTWMHKYKHSEISRTTLS